MSKGTKQIRLGRVSQLVRDLEAMRDTYKQLGRREGAEAIETIVNKIKWDFQIGPAFNDPE